MIINIHDTTPASTTPKYVKWMFAGLFALMYSVFALLAFCLIHYAGSILFGIFIAIFPFLCLFWFLWDQRKLANSFIEVSEHSVEVTEYPFGRKSVIHIQISDIDHARLVRPSSWKLRGPRIKDIGIPYIVFYDKQGKQLFKLLAYPEAIQFQQSITHLVEI